MTMPSGVTPAYSGGRVTDYAFTYNPDTVLTSEGLSADHNMVGWTFNPAMIQGGTILPTAGLLHVVRVKITSTVITNIVMHVSTAGATLTANRNLAAIFNSAGALLGAGAVTADQSTAWSSTGLKTMPLSVAQAVSGSSVYVGFYANGTTLPTFSRAGTALAGVSNVGLAAPNFKYATADTGLTTAMPANIGTQTAIATTWWVGLS